MTRTDDPAHVRWERQFIKYQDCKTPHGKFKVLLGAMMQYVRRAPLSERRAYLTCPRAMLLPGAACSPMLRLDDWYVRITQLRQWARNASQQELEQYLQDPSETILAGSPLAVWFRISVKATRTE